MFQVTPSAHSITHARSDVRRHNSECAIRAAIAANRNDFVGGGASVGVDVDNSALVEVRGGTGADDPILSISSRTDVGELKPQTRLRGRQRDRAGAGEVRQVVNQAGIVRIHRVSGGRSRD